MRNQRVHGQRKTCAPAAETAWSEGGIAMRITNVIIVIAMAATTLFCGYQVLLA